MIDQLTYRAVAAKVALTGLVVGAFGRLDRDDRGQGSVEYIGIILVVVAIIGVLVTKGSEIGTAISTRLTAAVNSIGG
jgi:Flp pilus assembly pilin Flp